MCRRHQGPGDSPDAVEEAGKVCGHTKVSWQAAQNSGELSIGRVETEQKSDLQPSR